MFVAFEYSNDRKIQEFRDIHRSVEDSEVFGLVGRHITKILTKNLPFRTKFLQFHSPKYTH